MNDERLRHIWEGMIDRCENPESRQWKRYGGRGIRVCERWMDFEAFKADVSPTPDGQGLDRPELHRIDNDKGYEPGNCKWLKRMEHLRHHHWGRPLIVDDMMMQM